MLTLPALCPRSYLRLEGSAGIVTKRFVVFDDLEASVLL